MGISTFDEYEPLFVTNQILVTAGNTGNPVFHNNGNAFRVDQLFLTNSSDIDVLVSLQLSPQDDGTVPLGKVNVPAGAGNDPAVPPVDVFPSIIASLTGLVVGPGDELFCMFDAIADHSGYLAWICLGGKV